MTAPRPPWIVWIGLAVVLAAAAVLSFDGLRGLALTVGIPADLAWLLPIAVDAGAAVSCATWLGGRTASDAARYAGWMTWALLATTVVGNAGHLGMVAEGITPPWWVAVLVGAIPPAVVGATVHLIVLVGRTAATQPTGQDSDRPPVVLLEDETPALAGAEPTPEPTFEAVAEAVQVRALRLAPNLTPTPPRGIPVVAAVDEDEVAKVKRLLAAGTGRTVLMRELDLKDHQAKALLATPDRAGELLARYRAKEAARA